MATEETIGTIIQKLSLDMKEFETSVGKAEGLSKALKMSLKDLGTLAVDPSGKLLKSLDDVSVKQETATESTRRFFREQRLQDRVFRESVQSITMFTFALSFLTRGNESASATTQKLEKSLLAGVAAANGAEFAFFGLGRALQGAPGLIGRLGGALSNLGGPIGIVLGVGAALVTFFQQSNEEAKKAADEGLKDYQKALDEVSSSMDKFLPKVEKAQEQLYQQSLERVEAQLKIFRDIQTQMQAGTSLMNLTEEDAKRAGLTAIELGKMTGEMLETKIKQLQDEQRRLAILLRSVGMTVVGAAGALKPGDVKAPKASADTGGSRGPSDNARSLDQYIKDWNAQQERERQHVIAVKNERARAQEEYLRKQEAGWQRDMASAQNLGAVLEAAFSQGGDTLLAKLARALQIAFEIAKAIRFAESADAGAAGPLGIIASVIPIVGLLKGQAGTSGISDRIDTESRRSLGGYAPAIRVSGKVDLSNGELHLIQVMPAVNRHFANKAV